MAIVIAVLLFTMPAGLAIRASILGAVIGFFPIGWIVLNVIFMYRLTVATGAFATLQQAIGGVTPDRRLQLLLIAFAFGAFFEGASGFGTPVAVTAAILIGLGFSPLAASGLSLIANTAPVAYGALGTPIAGLASVTGLDPYLLGAMVGRQLPFFSLIVPAWLICAFAGWRGMLQIWPAILVCGVSFAIPQFLISNFVNPWIVDIGASLICMACLIVFPGSGNRRSCGPRLHCAATTIRLRRCRRRAPPGRSRRGAGLVVARAVDYRVRRIADLGHRLVQGAGQSDLYLELSGGGAHNLVKRCRRWSPSRPRNPPSLPSLICPSPAPGC